MFKLRRHIIKLTDEEIIELYQKNARNKYIAVLYERYYHLVFGVCLKYLTSIEESEDAVTLIFEKLIKDLKTAQINKFSGWLYMVSKNYCLQQLRKKKYSTIDFTSLENVLQEENNLQLEKESVLELLESKIELLNEEQKKCITLFYLNKKSYTDIVSLTNYELKNVKSYIQNGKRNLKIMLERDYMELINKIA